MYLNIDLASPAMGAYLLNSKAKRRVLDYWAKTTVNGVEVFDKLYLYNGAVVETPSNLKIYELMGIKVDELKAETYDGVESIWLYFKYTDYLTPSEIADQQLYDYVHESCNNETTYEITLNYVDTYYNGSPLLLGEDLKLHIDNLFTQAYDGNSLKVLNSGNNPAYFVALQDFNNILFETSATVGTTKITESSDKDEFGVNKFITCATAVKFRYKLKTATVLECDALFSRVKASAFIPSDFYGYVDDIDPAGVFVSENIYYDPTIAVNGVTDVDTGFASTIKNRYLPVQTFRDMTAREAGKFLQKAIDSDYKEEEADWWEKLLNVIIIIIAVVITIMSGGSAAGAAVGLVNTVGAFATVATTVLTVTLVVQFALSYLMQAAGNYGGAIIFGKSMVMVTNVLKIVGILALFASIIRVITEGFTKAILNEAGKEIGRQAMSFGDIGLQIIGWLNKGFGVYNDYEQAENADELADAEARLAEQEEAEMMARTPQAMELMQVNFESGYFMDANAQMDNIPYQLTQGKIDSSTTKYYS